MKRLALILWCALFSSPAFSETSLSVAVADWNASEAKAKAIVSRMTPEEKAGQMIQAERRYMSRKKYR